MRIKVNENLINLKKSDLILNHGTYWHAEHGLANTDRAFLIILPLLILFVTQLFLNRKEKRHMNNNTNAFEALNITFQVINNLSGNIAGGALLANTVYDA